MEKRKEFKQLTKAEESIMQALWSVEPAFIKDIIAAMPSPQPHYNTVSTLIKILVEKGFASIESLGNAHRYAALISKDDYSRRSVKQLVKGYFNNFFADMVSFFAAIDDTNQYATQLLMEVFAAKDLKIAHQFFSPSHKTKNYYATKN